MTTKLQKLEKIRLAPSRQRVGLPAAQPVTQTIIINNPNININYMNEASRPNGPLSSRGLDNWHLNNNLKEFSQTRQLGFFKGRKQRNKSNSPYVIHKVRTQDLRSINKIYAPLHPYPLKETLSNFRKNQTIAHMSPSEPLRQQTSGLPLQKILAQHDKTITQKLYQGKLRKTPRAELQKNYQTLPTNYLNTTNPELQQPKSFRRGRFEAVPDSNLSLTERKVVQSRESSGSIDSPDKGIRTGDRQQREERADELEQLQTKEYRPIVTRLVPFEMRRRAFNKTIAKIDQSLLGNTESYFERLQSERLPQAQIELLVNSVGHPEQVRERGEGERLEGWGEYDFQFEEERKKRPKTPKKKKQYEED